MKKYTNIEKAVIKIARPATLAILDKVLSDLGRHRGKMITIDKIAFIT